MIARSVFLSVALCLAASAARTQCTVTQVTFGSYGTGCNPVFPSQVPALSGAWNAPACSVDLTLNGFSGCCNTFLRSRMLILGGQQANVPLPWAGTGCTLLASPDVLIAFPVSSSNLLSLPLPPGIPRATLYGQGLLVYFTTIGMTTDLAFAPGLTLTIQ
jgi:hypothetical protein